MFAQLTADDIASRVEGPLLFLRRTLDVGYNEAVEVQGSDGIVRMGRIATVDDDIIVVEVLDDTAGLSLSGTRIRFFGEPLKFDVGKGILDRIFNGMGEVIDGGPPIAAEFSMRIDGLPMKPVAREAPKNFLQTGITAIDLMNSLVLGQKLPIFSGGGLPHDQIAMSIAANAQLGSSDHEEFAIVFAGIGVPHETAEYFQREMERSGALEHSALFLNMASDSSAQRLLTPRYALTAAEYLAFTEGKHVLVIMTDMTN